MRWKIETRDFLDSQRGTKDCVYLYEDDSGLRLCKYNSSCGGLYGEGLYHVIIEDQSESTSSTPLINALTRLVELKDLKDREGKRGYYETHQPAAWKQARKALAEFEAHQGEAGKEQAELWNEIGAFAYGSSSFKWYPEKMAELKSKYHITLK